MHARRVKLSHVRVATSGEGLGCRSPDLSKSSANLAEIGSPLLHGRLTTTFIFSRSAYLPPIISY